MGNTLFDDTSEAITLSENFYFYGQAIRDVYVRKFTNKCKMMLLIFQVGDNGIIGLNSVYNIWTPKLLPFNGAQFIAPYWADVDLTGTGQVYYRQTKNPVLLARATSEIQTAFPLSYPFSKYLTVTNLIVVTWDAVGYYPEHTDKVG